MSYLSIDLAVFLDILYERRIANTLIIIDSFTNLDLFLNSISNHTPNPDPDRKTYIRFLLLRPRALGRRNVIPKGLYSGGIIAGFHAGAGSGDPVDPVIHLLDGRHLRELHGIIDVFFLPGNGFWGGVGRTRHIGDVGRRMERPN